jgi:inner membrane protein
MDFFSEITFWHWMLLGGILMLGEAFFPTFILLFIGLAAFLVGVINFFLPDANQYALLASWAVISTIMTIGWHIYSLKNKNNSSKIDINSRGDQYLGRQFTLKKAVVNNVGEMHVDDTRWRVVSDKDIAAGNKVKVIAVEGNSLKIEEATE